MPKPLKKVGSSHGGRLTVGRLRRLMATLPDDTAVIAEIHNDGERGWILNVHGAALSGAEVLDADPPTVLCLSLSRFCKHGLNPEECEECVDLDLL